MSYKIHGQSDEAVAFAKALGIDPRDTFKIELNIEVDEIVTVVIHKHIKNTELESVTAILKEFELHKKEDEEGT